MNDVAVTNMAVYYMMQRGSLAENVDVNEIANDLVGRDAPEILEVIENHATRLADIADRVGDEHIAQAAIDLFHVSDSLVDLFIELEIL